MRNLSALLAAALALGAVAAQADPRTSTWSSPVCGAGPAEERTASVDADGDGVVDSEDWCPTTKAGDRVGANGCAAWEIPVNCKREVAQPQNVRVVPVVEEPAPVAVPAPVSQSEPPPLPVAIDTDGDGVSDDDDRCPGTPKGTEVDRKGCAVISKVVLRGVNFATGSAKLLPAASETLKAVASAMKVDRDIKVEVGGHTDSVGSDKKNQALSEKRAKSVKDFLVKEGIEASRLTTKGYGKTQPADTNETKEGRANNRRVAFKES